MNLFLHKLFYLCFCVCAVDNRAYSTVCPHSMEYPMFMYKPRRGVKRGDDSKVNTSLNPLYNYVHVPLFI